MGVHQTDPDPFESLNFQASASLGLCCGALGRGHGRRACGPCARVLGWRARVQGWVSRPWGRSGALGAQAGPRMGVHSKPEESGTEAKATTEPTSDWLHNINLV